MAIVFPWLVDSPRSLASFQAHAAAMTHISPTWLAMNAAGEIACKEQPEVAETARAHGLRLCPLVVNEGFRVDVADALFRDPARRRENAGRLCALVRERGWDGLNLDFEGPFLQNCDHYTDFVDQVSRQLRPRGVELSIDVVGQTRAPHPVPAGDAPAGHATWADPYDYAALGALVDRFMIMGYDFHHAAGPPGAVGPAWWLRQVLEWTLRHVPARKVVLGLPFYARRWTVAALDRFPDSRYMTYPQVAELLRERGGEPLYDWDAQSWQYRWREDGAEHVAWFDDAASLGARMRLVREYGLAGVAFWCLGQEDERVWEAVAAVKGW